MAKRFALLAMVLASAALASPQRTLRLDYFHAGKAGTEHFAPDGVALEGPWPGHPARNIDDTNLGKYFFEVADRKTGRVLYSRGFASIYGEWETTAEAKQHWRVFHESVRFPEPAAPVRVAIRKRDARNVFREVWSTEVDPAGTMVDRTPANASVRAVIENGPPANKVDLLLMGDGYTAAEMEKWRRDAQRAADVLFAVSPFRERRADFNVWAVDTPALESGVARPSDGLWRRSPLRASYDAFGSERYVLTFDNKRLREAAAAAPYEFIVILVNDCKYGGGGIFNLYATLAAGSAFAPYLLVHEFGHSFAGLADEYYTSDVAYESTSARLEPWEPNVTADPRGSKWKDLADSGTPLPTPWPKQEYETWQKQLQARRRAIREAGIPEAKMEALFREEGLDAKKLLGGARWAGRTGAFEGAMYESSGYFRPQVDCIMFSRNEAGFCPVCRRAIERVIALYTGR